MYCENCGNQINDGAHFCKKCGKPVDGADAAEPKEQSKSAQETTKVSVNSDAPQNQRQKQQAAAEINSAGDIQGQKVTDNIYRCPDGKYRWVYEYKMLKNPTILITVMKAILLSFGAVMGFVILIDLIGGDFRYWTSNDFASFATGFFIFLLVMLALGAFAYLILAALYGWTYQVLFTMDEDGVEFKQMKKDFQKSQAIGWLTAAAGLATGSLGRTGTGIIAATRDSSYSEFKQVRKVQVVRRRHVIYVNQMLGHNQVYAEDADFDFVEKFIIDRCPNAKVKK